MAENTMKLEVITPERSFYTGDVTFVELNTTEGEVGIYARHIPMTMIIAPGVLTITEEDGTKKKAALLKGFVEVTETTMSILAEVAEWPEDIDVARVEAVDFLNHAILHSRHETAPFLRQESDEAEIETVEEVPIGIDDTVCGLVIHAAADVNRRKRGEKQPVRRKKWTVHLKNSFCSLQRTAITGA